MNQDETVEILQELLNSIRNRGFRKTINLLKTEQQDEPLKLDDYEWFLLNTVAEKFNIPVNDMLNSKYMRGDNKYAVGLCVLYLYETKSLGDINKKIFKNKNKTLLSKYRQLVIDLNSNHTEDRKILAIKIEADKLIANYKKPTKDHGAKSSTK